MRERNVEPQPGGDGIRHFRISHFRIADAVSRGREALNFDARLLALFSVTACAGAQEPYVMQREAMVREQIEARGVKDPRVLDALRRAALAMARPSRSRTSSR